MWVELGMLRTAHSGLHWCSRRTALKIRKAVVRWDAWRSDQNVSREAMCRCENGGMLQY